MKKYLLIFQILILVLSDIYGETMTTENNEQPESNQIKIKITLWQNDCQSAFSFTFDDGMKSHYTELYPLLKKYGFKATFFVNGPKLAKEGEHTQWRFGSWKQFTEMALNGYEIGNHSLTHPHMNTLETGDTNTPGTLHYEVFQNKKMIEHYITNQKCISFAYPFCERNNKVDEVIEQYHEAARTCSGRPNRANLNENQWMDISSEGLSFMPVRTDLDKEMEPVNTYLKRLENNSIKNNMWSVFLAHEVIPLNDIKAGKNQGSWQPMALEAFEKMLIKLKEKADKKEIWIDTFGSIAQYIKERQNFDYKILSIKENEIQIEPGLKFCTFGRADFKIPLTAEITVPEDWQHVFFIQEDSKTNITSIKSDDRTYIQVNIIPNYEPIILVKSQ